MIGRGHFMEAKLTFCSRPVHKNLITGVRMSRYTF